MSDSQEIEITDAVRKRILSVLGDELCPEKKMLILLYERIRSTPGDLGKEIIDAIEQDVSKGLAESWPGDNPLCEERQAEIEGILVGVLSQCRQKKSGLKLAARRVSRWFSLGWLQRTR